MKEESKHIIPYELFIKYLNNELSEHEDITLKSWLKAGADHPDILDEYKRAWELMDNVRDVADIDMDKEWHRQRNEINAIGGGAYSSFEDPVTNFKWSVSKVAAVFLVLILSAITIYFVLPQFTQEKIASNTEIRKLVLPDGSEVTLNTNSRIKYPTTFNTHERRVYIKGEAYFKVAHNPDAPFRISTDKASIEVLGTSFNVSAYQTREMVEVVVTEGTVALASKDNPDNRIILDKGTKGIFDPSNNYLLKKSNSDRNYLSWKTRKIVFENDSLSMVLNTLAKVYDRNITLHDQNLGQCTLTVTFENQSLESVIKVIESTLNIELKEEGDMILVSGEGC